VPAAGWRVYGEFLLDDYSFSSDYKPDMIGYQAGLEWRRMLGSRDDRRLAGEGSVGSAVSGHNMALGALLEYSRVHNYTYSVYHHHDFAFEGFPIGYVLGPDVQFLVGQASLEWGRQLGIPCAGRIPEEGRRPALAIPGSRRTARWMPPRFRAWRRRRSGSEARSCTPRADRSS
jgi:hypothetical protein